MSQKNYQVSWDQFHRDARTLARRLMDLGPFRGMAAVTRGGLVPAAIVARELNLRLIDTFCVVSYGADNDLGQTKILKRITAELAGDEGHGLLVIDDLVDTGTTARLIREQLPKAHIATLYAKPMGLPLVDTFVMEVAQETWIDFPWDLGLDFQAPLVPR